MKENRNFNIYLFKSNLSNFKNYLKPDYRDRVRQHYIKTDAFSELVVRGLILIYDPPPPDQPGWVDYLNSISQRNNLRVKARQNSQALVFLTIKDPARRNKNTFAFSFGNGAFLLEQQQVVHDFGLRVARGLLDKTEVTSIDTTSFDKKVFNTKKQSAAFLLPERLIDFGTQNIVQNIHGKFKDEDTTFSLGGSSNLSFRGLKLSSGIEEWLNEFLNLYLAEENKIDLDDELLKVDKEQQDILDGELADKILSILNYAEITRRHVSKLKILPNITFDLEDFDGFFLTGLGYKKSFVSSDTAIDEVSFFERLQFQMKADQRTEEKLLNKLKNTIIHKKSTKTDEIEPVCSVYKALNYEVTLNGNMFILVNGSWYKIDPDFYSALRTEINNLKEPEKNQTIDFLKFDKNKDYKIVKKNGEDKKELSEGEYNERLSDVNQALMMDRKDYQVDKDTKKRFGIKSGSSIEVCDLLHFDDERIQFIHVKRHSGASGTSHLLTQSTVSAHCFLNDQNAIVEHINDKIVEQNRDKPFTVPELTYQDQEKEVVLVIVDEKYKGHKNNNQMLSLLEMVAMRSTIRELKSIGFKCYLKFIAVKN